MQMVPQYPPPFCEESPLVHSLGFQFVPISSDLASRWRLEQLVSQGHQTPSTTELSKPSDP